LILTARNAYFEQGKKQESGRRTRRSKTRHEKSRKRGALWERKTNVGSYQETKKSREERKNRLISTDVERAVYL
jgi:phosphoribosyl-AMP cyclohydrolase